MDLILFGIQGSGKGTLGAFIAAKYGYTVFETGGELRKLASQDSDLGKKIKGMLEKGQLVTDELVMEIIENFMANLPRDAKILFDGMPRTMEQAFSFEALMKKQQHDFMGIQIDVPKDVVLKRLSTRRICKNCKAVYPASYAKDNCEKCNGELVTRSDDNPESINKRIEAYFAETMPVIEHFKSSNKIIIMDGNKNIEDCRVAIFKIIDEQIKQ